VAYGAGRLLLRAFHLDLTRLEGLTLSTSLGLGAISQVTFFLGLAGLLYPLVFYAIFVAASVAIVGVTLKHKDILQKDGPQRTTIGLSSCLRVFVFENRLSLLLAIFIALTEGLALLAALTPPWAWDSLVYHLTGPELYMAQHRIFGGLDGMHFYFPPLVEMLFLDGMLLKGPIVAGLIHWEFGLLAVGAVFCFARRLFGVQVAWLAAAILLSAPSVVILSSKAYVDLALVLYLTLSLWCAVAGFREGKRNWWLLAAIFLGLAGGIKYTGLVGMLAVIVTVAVEARLGSTLGRFVNRPSSPAKASTSWQRGEEVVLPRRLAGAETLTSYNGQQRRPSRRFVLVCCLVVAVVAAPWYLKNLAFTGNPFYPFLLGGPFWDSFRADWVSRGGSGLMQQPWRLLLAPLEMTILGVEGGLGYQATIGPLFLALLPLLFLMRRGQWIEGTGLRGSLVFVAVMYAVWLVGIAWSEPLRQTRLLLPAFGVLSAAVACAVYRFRVADGLNLQHFVGGAIALALALSLVTQTCALMADSPLPFIVGAESEKEYLAHHLVGYYEAAEHVNASLGEDAKVYFLWEPRSFYFQRIVQPDTLLDNWRHHLLLEGDGDAILATLRKQGYTHLLINLDSLRYYSEEPHREVNPEDIDALLAFEKRHLRLIYGDTVESIYSFGQGISSPGSYSLSRLE
ncbi:MAG: glycosyltransferase family 39 protein, partial [Dehalococcoidia bacterium]|nr:glycosyltransferase family 39 protein [Dehalococcoidia bacterium]